jgi:hypothetical protein
MEELLRTIRASSKPGSSPFLYTEDFQCQSRHIYTFVGFWRDHTASCTAASDAIPSKSAQPPPVHRDRVRSS